MVNKYFIIYSSAVKAESPLDLNFDEQMCLIAIVGDKTFTATTIKEDTSKNKD